MKRRLLFLSIVLACVAVAIFLIFGLKREESDIQLDISLPAPEINIEPTSVSVCPGGTIPDFSFTVTDEIDGDITKNAEKKYHENGLVSVVSQNSRGGTAVSFVRASVGDTTAPVISLGGESSYTLQLGSALDLPEASATDACDGPVSVERSGSFDANTVGTYDILYSAKDSHDNSSEQKVSITVLPKNNGVIYLTFDDGPGPYTSGLLDILKKYNVKATFFVTCGGSDDLIRREFDEGHTVALHTCSHNYAYLYSSVAAFFDDLYSVQNRVKNITGVAPTLTRFPGGSSNTVSAAYDGGAHIMSTLASELPARGFTYFDWNISSGDAGGAYTTDAVAANVINSLVYDGNSVILQHDIKDFSVAAVEHIIVYGLEHGYTFARLESSSPTAHHGINN